MSVWDELCTQNNTESDDFEALTLCKSKGEHALLNSNRSYISSSFKNF